LFLLSRREARYIIALPDSDLQQGIRKKKKGTPCLMAGTTHTPGPGFCTSRVLQRKLDLSICNEGRFPCDRLSGVVAEVSPKVQRVMNTMDPVPEVRRITYSASPQGSEARTTMRL